MIVLSTRRGTRFLAAALAIGPLTGCKPEPLPTAQAAAEPDETTKIGVDLHTLCTRITTRHISAWSQPLYWSERIRNLTIAVDRGDMAARCELGKLMRAHRLPECRDTGSNLRRQCKASSH